MVDLLQPLSVRRRVDVELSRATVEHALRCYLANIMANGIEVPHPAVFNSIEVEFNLLGEQHTATGCPEIGTATLTYAPASSTVALPTAAGRERLRVAAEALVQRYVEYRGTPNEMISGVVNRRGAGVPSDQVWAEWDELRRALGEEIPS